MKTIDTANELLGAIDILVNQAIRDNSTQIYNGVCKSITNTSTCVMTINGKDNNVKFYGVSPNVGGIYRVFVPNGNMSMAFIITIVDNPGAIGAAPAGYGLGANSKHTTDWNNEKTNGWVRDPGGTADKHSPFVGLFSVGLISEYGSGGDTFQLAFARDQFAKTRTYIKFRAYNADSNVWGEWEWLNPPMAPGVEYRTTERYNNKPVYKKLISVGSVGTSSGIVIRNYASNVGYVVEYDLYSQYAGRAETRDSELYVSEARPNYFIITNRSTSFVYENSLLYVAYTKTTD